MAEWAHSRRLLARSPRGRMSSNMDIQTQSHKSPASLECFRVINMNETSSTAFLCFWYIQNLPKGSSFILDNWFSYQRDGWTSYALCNSTFFHSILLYISIQIYYIRSFAFRLYLDCLLWFFLSYYPNYADWQHCYMLKKLLKRMADWSKGQI